MMGHSRLSSRLSLAVLLFLPALANAQLRMLAEGTNAGAYALRVTTSPTFGVGIGTGIPSVALHVVGQGFITSGLTASSGTFTQTGSASYSLNTSSGISVGTGQVLLGSGSYVQWPDGTRSTTAVTQASGGGGSSAAFSSQTFTGNGTWTRPTGVTVVDVVMCAGGGGGGGTAAGPAGGGGAGGYIHRMLDVSTMSSIAVTIGAGGSAGNNGSATFLASFSADGGGAGGDGATDAPPSTGENGSAGGSGGGGGGRNITGSGGGGGGAGGPGWDAVSTTFTCPNVAGSTTTLNQGNFGGCGQNVTGFGGRGGAGIEGLAYGGGGGGAVVNGQSGIGSYYSIPDANTCAGGMAFTGGGAGASGKVVITVIR